MRTGWTRDDRIAFTLAAALALMGGTLLLLGMWLAGALMGVEAVLLASFRPQLRAAHNYAWLAGRSALIFSMVEAQNRQMPVEDWILAEAERDGFGPQMAARIRRLSEGEP